MHQKCILIISPNCVPCRNEIFSEKSSFLPYNIKNIACTWRSSPRNRVILTIPFLLCVAGTFTAFLSGSTVTELGWRSCYSHRDHVCIFARVQRVDINNEWSCCIYSLVSSRSFEIRAWFPPSSPATALETVAYRAIIMCIFHFFRVACEKISFTASVLPDFPFMRNFESRCGLFHLLFPLIRGLRGVWRVFLLLLFSSTFFGREYSVIRNLCVYIFFAPLTAFQIKIKRLSLK